VQNREVELVIVSVSDQLPGSQRQGEVVVAAAARSGHNKHESNPGGPLKAAKGEVVALVDLLVVEIERPVSWQVREAVLIVNP
jgi:hypothetical protein